MFVKLKPWTSHHLLSRLHECSYPMLSCKHSLNQIFNSTFSLHCSGTMAFPSLESHWALTIGFLISWFGLVKFHHVSTWEEHLSESKWFVLSNEISIPEICMFINHIYKTDQKVVQSYTFCYLHVMKLVWKNLDVRFFFIFR